MPFVVPFKLRTKFTVQFYEKLGGCWIQTADVPPTSYDQVAQLLTRFDIVEYMLEYVSHITKKTVTWTGDSLQFELETLGLMPHYRDPELYSSWHLKNTIEYHESQPKECQCILNGRQLRFRFSDPDVSLIKFAPHQQRYVPLNRESYLNSFEACETT